jgi:Protein of unknown function (DUF3775)
MATLRISPEKVCFVVVKARELDVKVAPEELDQGSNPTDDQMIRILEDYADDPTFEELQSFLEALNDDELEDLLALTWLGRGDYTLDDWGELMEEIRDVRERHTVGYLLGTPLLPDYLEDGLAEFGLSCDEFEIGHM